MLELVGPEGGPVVGGEGISLESSTAVCSFAVGTAANFLATVGYRLGGVRQEAQQRLLSVCFLW